LHALFAPCFMLISCLAYPSTLKMEVTCSTETSVDFQRTTWRYIPEDRTLHNHRCENVKSCKNNPVFLISIVNIRPFCFSTSRKLGAHFCQKSSAQDGNEERKEEMYCMNYHHVKILPSSPFFLLFCTFMSSSRSFLSPVNTLY
jgi:hypothetical protein